MLNDRIQLNIKISIRNKKKALPQLIDNEEFFF